MATTPNPVARFGTVLGAVVEMTTHRQYDRDNYAWHCQGCQASSFGSQASADSVRTEANDHASTCRALPA